MRKPLSVAIVVVGFSLAVCMENAVQSARAQGKNAGSTKNDATSKEKAKLIGTWNATDSEVQGVRTGAGGLKDMTWKFTADKVTYTLLGGKKVEASYKLQPDKKPATFDFKGPESAIQGIYELKGDTLKVCFAALERPASFATGGTTQDTLMIVFKRAGR